MTYEQTREAFVRIMNENAYTHLCQLADIKNAIDAIDKQIPKKPIGKHTSYKCPICGRRVRSGKGSSSFGVDHFCQRCGQALDWSDTECQ
jgi:DNA-directed RNA polymerase subunit RPC12/RpoP